MKANILRGEMVAKGYTVKDVANKMGMSRNTLSSRLNGRSSFDTEEIINICKILDIRDASRKSEIFLT